MTPVRTVARFAGSALAGVVLLSAPAPARAQMSSGVPDAFMQDFQQMKGKFNELAAAMESGTYAWRPMEGVRSVAEVYTLIATEAYYIPSMWGGAPPDGMTIDNQIWGRMAQLTDRDEILEHLRRSFDYCEEALESLSADDMRREIQFFGDTRTVQDALYIMLADMHEHLGQAIAYARSNEVVPPWTARQGG